ncbi:hypothetical protein D7V86_09110 [bacterium D16-51]|nr:hypothetical protein D7V96_09900 [bacterium D16-59]RKI60355.1 hypothetical protein D7V86_09110 [bacterium D16-51]
MDWLFRIFYTILSLGILMVILLPVIILFRFLLRNYEKKYTIWGWRIFYLRSICPVALSSALCLFPLLNRKYHLLLANLGLSVAGKTGGIMSSWRVVYQGKVTAAGAFKICSIIWVIGIAVIFCLAVISNRRFRKELKKANQLGEGIYESSSLSVPVSLGFVHKKLYLPKGFQAKEMGWLLRHMEAHRFAGVRSVLAGLVLTVHWFNPVMWLYYFWWKSDMEMAADEKTVYRKNESVRKEYAQGILNFNKALSGEVNRKSKPDNGIILFPGIIEGNIEKRAYRMLYRRRDLKRDRLAAVLLLSVIVIFCFLLAPIKLAWDGGTWGKGNPSENAKKLGLQSDTVVVTKMGTTSPEGLERVIQLEMVSGEEGKKEYAGDFVLRMYDSVGNKIGACTIETLFPEVGKGKQRFSKDTALCIHDYNGDGAKELVIGQEADLPEEIGDETGLAAYVYAIVGIESKSLEVICREITAIGRKAELGNSVYFENPKEIDDIFIVPENEKMLYYVWVEEKGTYEKRDMTEEGLEAHKKGAELSKSGETQEHSLDNDNGGRDILVTTKRDDTGSEAIQSVIASPGNSPKKFDGIEGYYCDLLWLTDGKGKKTDGYAQLIYNGKKAQTFVVFDTGRKSVYYKHEDGAKQLADVFNQYGEKITFQEQGTVVYSLMSKENDVLRIGFAANADHGITVKGNYDYDVVKRTASNLSFNRSGDGETSPSPSPAQEGDSKPSGFNLG